MDNYILITIIIIIFIILILWATHDISEEFTPVNDKNTNMKLHATILSDIPQFGPLILPYDNPIQLKSVYDKFPFHYGIADIRPFNDVSSQISYATATNAYTANNAFD